MSSKLESDVCCSLQVAPSGESYEGKRRPGRKQWQTTARYMAWFTSRHLLCGLNACTPGSAPGPMLGNEHGKTLPLPLHTHTNLTAIFLGLPRWAGTKNVKPIWILLKQKRQWVAVAVASAGPYASLHLAPDRQPHQQPTTLFFYRPVPCLPPNQQRQSTEGNINIKLSKD